MNGHYNIFLHPLDLYLVDDSSTQLTSSNFLHNYAAGGNNMIVCIECEIY